MGKIISCLSQKGGVTKSSTARTLAIEFTRSGWNVHVGEIDNKQQTIMRWNLRREERGLTPTFECAIYHRPETAIKASHSCDLLIIDGRPAAEHSCIEIAKASDLVVLTTGATIDDLEPSLELGRELVKNGISKDKIVYLIAKATSEAEGIKALATVEVWGFRALKGVILSQPAYGQALDKGRALTETPYPSLNERAMLVVEEIHDIIN